MNLHIFNGWDSVAGVLLKTLILYVYTIFLLRIGGKRVMGKISTFDFVSIIIMGPLIATSILSANVAIIDGMIALTAFVALQWLVSYLSVRSRRFARIVTNSPRVLFADARFLRENIAHERIHEDEIIAKIREAGYATTDSVKAVVLESSGDLSVIAAAVPEKPVEEDPIVLGSLQQ